MARTSISPNFFLDPDESEHVMTEKIMHAHYDENSISTKIMIYEDRINGWFFDIAEFLKENPHSGFVILMIAISQIEGIEQFRMGRTTDVRETKDVLKNSLRRIFTIPSQHQEALDILIEDVRHGFFHDGIIRKRVLLTNDPNSAISLGSNQKSLLINPHLFLEAVRSDFRVYITKLTDQENTELRSNFEKRWNECY